MEGDGGGSEVSYESVASEGGYEAASERGRDAQPRIITSSTCVQAFQRLRWDAAFNLRAASPDAQELKAKAAGEKAGTPLLSEYVLRDLPSRVMRFDGAMEAWLEELPPPEQPEIQTVVYSSLHDASTRSPELSVLKAGNLEATIWYFTQDFLMNCLPLIVSNGDEGLAQWVHALFTRGCDIQATHVELGRVDYPLQRDAGSKARIQWLKSVFSALQTSKWSPNHEARDLIRSRKVSHASMSVGDCVQIGRQLWIVLPDGFKAVKQAATFAHYPDLEVTKLLPQGTFDPEEPESPVSEKDEEAEEEAAEPVAPKKNKNKKNKGKGKAENTAEPSAAQENGTAAAVNAGEDHGHHEGGKANGKKGNRKNNKKNQDGGSKGENAWQDNSWQDRSWQDNAWNESGWQDNSWQDNSWQGARTNHNAWNEGGGWQEPLRGGKGKGKGKGGKGSDNGRGKGGGVKGDYDSRGAWDYADDNSRPSRGQLRKQWAAERSKQKG